MRRGSTFWGAVLLVAGALLLMQNMGILTINVWQILWPIVIILFGLWFLLRVTGDGKSGGSDSVAVLDAKSLGGALSLKGVNGIRPAGDFVGKVTIHEGDLVDGTCTGRVLGTAVVDPGSGRWEFNKPVVTVPEKICVRSPGGGAYSQVM